jgi:hypothetical protein
LKANHELRLVMMAGAIQNPMTRNNKTMHAKPDLRVLFNV